MARLTADWGHSLSCDIGATPAAGERAALFKLLFSKLNV